MCFELKSTEYGNLLNWIVPSKTKTLIEFVINHKSIICLNKKVAGFSFQLNLRIIHENSLVISKKTYAIVFILTLSFRKAKLVKSMSMNHMGASLSNNW